MKFHIDWLTLSQLNLGQFTPLNDGQVVCLKADGTVEWGFHKHLTVKGSHDTSARIRVTADKAELSFNPSRWNSPDNLTGCSWEKAISIANGIMADFGQPPFEPGPVEENSDGQLTYTGAIAARIDIATNIATENPEAFTRKLSQTKLPHSKTSRIGTSVYFNAGSTNRVRKAYIKADDIRRHKKQLTPFRSQVADLCDAQGIVRLEVELRASWLRKNGMRAIQNISDTRLMEVAKPMIEEMKVEAEDDGWEKLTAKEAGILAQWKQGLDWRKFYSQATQYRHRKGIKEKTGYDVFDDTITPFRQAEKTIWIGEIKLPDWYLEAHGLLDEKEA